VVLESPLFKQRCGTALEQIGRYLAIE